MKTSKEEKIQAVEGVMAHFYQETVAPELNEAVLYSLQAGGKRIRPILLLELLEAFGLRLTAAHFQVAATVELIHTGSLIHDDLPAMDDDDYRRGRLTNHKIYGEATAILAGDSLFLDPFAFLADLDLPSPVLLHLIKELSKASGTFGMVAGQVLDMAGEGQSLNLDALQKIHAHKTGALLTFPFVAAGILAGVSPEIAEHLRQAGTWTGLAFQVRDDILDVVADFDQLGKTPQKDLRAEKSTYPALLGLDEARAFLNHCLNQALYELDQIAGIRDFEAESVRELIESMRLDNA